MFEKISFQFFFSVTCIEPGHEKICSGHGECRSGICKCDSLKPLENATGYLYEYSGKFCEECPYCKGQRCHKLLPCVQSLMRNLTDNRCDINYNLVENLQLKYNDKLCQVEDDRGCMMSFKYFYDDNASLYVDLERKVKCLNGKKCE